MLLFVSACVPRPDTEDSLVARRASDGSYYFVVKPRPPYEYTDVQPSDLKHERISAQAIESYLRSQIAWIGSQSKASFIIGEEHIVKSGDAYFSLVDVSFRQEPNFQHNSCSQPLEVLISIDGKPVAIYAGLGLCLV